MTRIEPVDVDPGHVDERPSHGALASVECGGKRRPCVRPVGSSEELWAAVVERHGRQRAGFLDQRAQDGTDVVGTDGWQITGQHDDRYGVRLERGRCVQCRDDPTERTLARVPVRYEFHPVGGEGGDVTTDGEDGDGTRVTKRVDGNERERPATEGHRCLVLPHAPARPATQDHTHEVGQVAVVLRRRLRRLSRGHHRIVGSCAEAIRPVHRPHRGHRMIETSHPLRSGPTPAPADGSHRGRIEAYFAACSDGTAEDIAGQFTPGAVVYDTNHAPVSGSGTIGGFWVRVRERWGGARWTVDRCVEQGEAAAIEWTMTGHAPRAFTVRGAEHYHFGSDGRIDEIRQYWTFDPEHLDTALVDYPYHDAGTEPGD